MKKYYISYHGLVMSFILFCLFIQVEATNYWNSKGILILTASLCIFKISFKKKEKYRLYLNINRHRS